MTLSIISCAGKGVRPVGHLAQMGVMTRAIVGLLSKGQMNLGREMAKDLTPIERGVVATKMLRDGVEQEVVLAVLS